MLFFKTALQIFKTTIEAFFYLLTWLTVRSSSEQISWILVGYRPIQHYNSKIIHWIGLHYIIIWNTLFLSWFLALRSATSQEAHAAAFPSFFTCWNTEYVVLYEVLFVGNHCLTIWACFFCWKFERRLQADSSVAKFSTKLSSLFSLKHFWTLGSLGKLYLFPNVSTQGK